MAPGHGVFTCDAGPAWVWAPGHADDRSRQIFCALHKIAVASRGGDGYIRFVLRCSKELGSQG